MKGYVENARVERILTPANGNVGVAVVEERQVKGETYRDYATLWFVGEPNERVEVGDLVNASGFVRARTRVKDGEVVFTQSGRPVTDVNLNSARIQSVQPGAAAGSEPEPPADDVWASDGGWH